MSLLYHTLQKQEFIVFWWCLLILEIDTLFDLSIEDCTFTASTIENFRGCSIAKLDSNWAYSRAWGGKLDYWCWLVIPLHWLFIQILTQMGFSTPCQIHQLNHVVVYINNFLSCQLHIFFNRHFFTSKTQEEMRVATSFAATFILNFSRSSSTAKSTL